MTSSINFGDLIKNVDTSAFTPIPQGTYDAAVDEADSVIAKSSGRNMIKVRLVITDGPCKNRKLWNNFVVVPENPNALAMMFRSLGQFGLDTKYFEQGPSIEQVARDMVGRHVQVTVKHEDYQGKTQERCDGFKLSNNVPGQIAAPSIASNGPAGLASSGPAPAAPVVTPQPVAAPPVAAAPAVAAPVAAPPVAAAPVVEAPPAVEPPAVAAPPAQDDTVAPPPPPVVF